jgi:TatD DNase family protein
MQLVDVHCHLESEAFQEGLDETLEMARRAGVRKLITASVHPAQWALSAALAARFKAVEFAVGVHPWYCPEEVMPHLSSLPEAAADAVAIGEIGLDSKTERFPLAWQIKVLIPQLRAACDLGLPGILHCRGAFNELLALFKKYGPPPGGVLHNFSGSPELAEQFMEYGLAFSMGGVLTWRNSAKRARVLRRIYPDHFLLETDAPDIPPVEARGAINTPANILYNLRAAAELLDLPAEEVAEATTRNATRIFKLRL